MLQNSSFFSLPSFFKPQQPRSINFPSSNVSLLPCYATGSNISQRKSANYQPNIWNYDTLLLLSLKHEYAEVQYVNRSMKLQEEVRRMINNENIEILELIENVKRLGLGYHFEKEIREALDRFIFSEKYGDTFIGKSLHDTALKFRLLREYGYDVCADIFQNFKDNNGNFKKCIVKDIKGMLSLYEASFLSYDGEQNLDEANSFTDFHLKRGLHDDRNNFFFEQVNHSLEFPPHRRFQRLETRWYIELYGKRKDANKVLLEAATLNFNIVQSNLLQDLTEMSRWWKKMGLASKLRFSRDRLTECFFFAVGMAFEYEFSDLSKSLTKVISLITTLDDLYDVYGTLDELEHFTTAVERWWKEMGLASKLRFSRDRLTECFFFAVGMAFEYEFSDLSKSLTKVISLITTLDDLYDVYGTLDELELFTTAVESWDIKAVQVLPEYMKIVFLALYNTINELSYHVLKDHQLDALPYFTKAEELQRGEKVNSIMCYMNENGVSEEVAYEYIQCLINETWKKLNRDRFIDSPFLKTFSKISINFARTAHCVYQNGDGHGVPDATTINRIRSLIIEPISLM